MKRYIKSAQEKKRYSYKGPAETKKGRVQVDWTTDAVSEKQALNQVKWHLCHGMVYDMRDTIVYPEYLTEVGIKADADKLTCPQCGRTLTDGGLCPICDNGEEDYDL